MTNAGDGANGVISVLAVSVGIWLPGRAGRRPMPLTGVASFAPPEGPGRAGPTAGS
ncbi:sugar porter family MFS transporter [Streptomyces boncukensis]|uniref:Sugar porter family MFS transporter n=1 Tax=Streptomyces boncukensis TaxID=2711219 RepID=A0A6G4WZ22_9ACTN|nr:sugar porter family MFS transporter [Streptomyces boncukensis]NGO70368.1 sugar porter family MFS transporter [Streptomyces boncukensis]